MFEILRLAWNNWYSVLGTLAAVALPLWLMHILRERRRRGRTLREKVKAKFDGARGPDLERMLNWLPQEGDRERRRALRRTGPLVPVRIAAVRPDGETAAATDEGLVLDRSTG